MEFQPDRERLRREYPLGEVEFPPSALKGKEQTKWVKLRDVVRWIWEEERDEVGWDNVAFAVQELPHPLVALRTSPPLPRFVARTPPQTSLIS